MAAATPNGTAKTSATAETMIDPTNNGRMPYQSCQKLAVIQSLSKKECADPAIPRDRERWIPARQLLVMQPADWRQKLRDSARPRREIVFCALGLVR